MDDIRGSPASHACWRDAAVQFAIWASVASVAIVMAMIAGDILMQGLSRLSWSFLTAEPRNAGRAGGIAPILVSTLMILLVAVAAALPTGIAAAVFLTEFAPNGSRVASAASVFLDVLAGVPSIVFGLFGNAFFCIWLGLGFSITSGGLTLACMALPIIVRAAEAGLRSVPIEWRQGAAGVELSRTSALAKIYLPAAAPAIAAGLMLGIGRAIAETAALIFTSGYVDRMPSSFSDSGRALAVHIYDLAMNVSGGDAQAYASALVLIAVVLAANVVALTLTRSVWPTGSSCHDAKAYRRREWSARRHRHRFAR